MLLENFRGQVLPLSENDLARFKSDAAGEYAYPRTQYETDSAEYSAKMRAAPELDNLLEKADARILSVVSIVLAVVFGMDAVTSFKNPNTGKNITSPVTEVQTSQTE